MVSKSLHKVFLLLCIMVFLPVYVCCNNKKADTFTKLKIIAVFTVSNISVFVKKFFFCNFILINDNEVSFLVCYSVDFKFVKSFIHFTLTVIELAEFTVRCFGMSRTKYTFFPLNPVKAGNFVFSNN